jgi:hypoxanthine phosphoribosyltransferase
MIFDLLEKIEDSGIDFTVVCGIERGGVHISKLLAEGLGLPHTQIKISFYQDDIYVPWMPVVNHKGVTFKKKDTVLLVDDLVDSGSTLKYFKKLYRIEQGDQKPNFKMATLFWNSSGKYNQRPDFFVDYKGSDWIVFPWEQEEETFA